MIGIALRKAKSSLQKNESKLRGLAAWAWLVIFFMAAIFGLVIAITLPVALAFRLLGYFFPELNS